MKLTLAQMQMTPNLDENYQKSLDYDLPANEVEVNKIKAGDIMLYGSNWLPRMSRLTQLSVECRQGLSKRLGSDKSGFVEQIVFQFNVRLQIGIW